MKTPWMKLFRLFRHIAPTLWELLVEGRQPETITWADLTKGLDTSRLMRDAAEAQSARRLAEAKQK